MSVLYSRILFKLPKGGGKDISMFVGSLNPNGVSSNFSCLTMELARVAKVKNCPALPLFIWLTCVATGTVVRAAIIVALIVPGASWPSAIRDNEARKQA